jgi:hypothetical protein
VRHLIERSVACAMLTLAASPANAQQGPFRFQEATIASIHAALAAGQLTCTQLTRLYLDRIAAYNTQGPALHAIITINPKAMEIADEMDRSDSPLLLPLQASCRTAASRRSVPRADICCNGEEMPG